MELLGQTGKYKVSQDGLVNEEAATKVPGDPEKAPDGGFVNEAFDGKHARPRPSVQLNVPPDTKEFPKPFRGMGKEVLLHHSSKPLWRRLRYVCVCIVLLGWLALIITVVALILVYPRCRNPRHPDWWQNTTVYRIYLRSFQDSDGNGIGDINGVTSRLEYLQWLGVKTISLSPFYTTKPDSMDDFDVIDHTTVNASLGSLEDFRRLVNETHERGMKVVVDFIPNLTSDEHPWFEESRQPNSSKRNFYVWSRNLPNNWKSVYNGSAWSLSTPRGEWYLHQFREGQPDLNLRSEEVRRELQSVMEFWLNEGVDGFYIRQSAYLFEDYDLRDEPVLSNYSGSSDAYAALNHTYTYAVSEVYDMLARWRAYLDDYGNQTKSYRLLFADVDGSQMLKYYGMFNRDGVDFPLNQLCLALGPTSNGWEIYNLVWRSLLSLPPDRSANWMGGDENSRRMHNRIGSNLTRNFLMLANLLPGIPFFYYGDEIGMTDSTVTNLSMRTPMQWDNSSDAGFCVNETCNPWLPINPDASKQNVMEQNSTFDSILHLFKNLTDLRGRPSFYHGEYVVALNDTEVFAFVREVDGQNGFLVALNFGHLHVTRRLYGLHSTIPHEAEVVLTTGSGVSFSAGDTVSLSSLSLEPYQGAVVSWSYVAKEL